MLYNGVETLSKQSQNIADCESAAVQIIKSLAEHQLVRSPEGVAVWLQVEQLFPKCKLPTDVWGHMHPLARKDITILAKVMNDARPQRPDNADRGPQGSAGWSPSLHFAWDIVLQYLYSLPVKGAKLRGGGIAIDFELFWKTSVEG